MIFEAVRDQLVADAGVAALCSSVFPTMRPLHIDPPFIIVTLDSDNRDRLLDGTQGTYRQAIISLDVYDTTLAAAIAIADAVESALIDYSGVMGTTSPQVDVNHARLERRGPHLFETDTSLHRVPLEILIGYEV